MRSLVHSGCPLSTVAETLIDNVGFRNEVLYQLKRSQKEWICRLLTAGCAVKNLKSKLTFLCNQVTWPLNVWMWMRRQARFVDFVELFRRQFQVGVPPFLICFEDGFLQGTGEKTFPVFQRVGTWRNQMRKVKVSIKLIMLTRSSKVLNAFLLKHQSFHEYTWVEG